MISQESATFVISIAKGLIKLGNRMDNLLAEKEAATSDLVLKMPPISFGVDRSIMVFEIKQFLE